MKNKILIIANGPSILNENFGSAIDNFNEVARINNYQIDGFHKHIGSKTTIWSAFLTDEIRWLTIIVVLFWL